MGIRSLTNESDTEYDRRLGLRDLGEMGEAVVENLLGTLEDTILSEYHDGLDDGKTKTEAGIMEGGGVGGLVADLCNRKGESERVVVLSGFWSGGIVHVVVLVELIILGWWSGSRTMCTW